MFQTVEETTGIIMDITLNNLVEGIISQEFSVSWEKGEIFKNLTLVDIVWEVEASRAGINDSNSTGRNESSSSRKGRLSVAESKFVHHNTRVDIINIKLPALLN
jgi:hypothetical protein